MSKQNYIIRYSQCWEDTELMLEALNIQEKDVVFSITSGGCNSIAMQTTPAERIIAIDSNPAQNYLLELKKTAIVRLEYHKLLGFLGITPLQNRIEVFNSLQPFLSDDCRAFWNNNPELVEEGLIHSGKFEKYLKAFRKFVLSITHSKKNIDKLLSITDKDFQLEFYNKVWNNLRWKSIFKVFFSERFMKNRGRSNEMFQYNESKSVGAIYYKRCEKAFSTGIVNKNSYLDYILKGNYSGSLPYYLKEKNHNLIKAQNNITPVTSDILNYLQKQENNSISKFNLSDIFESISLEKTNEIFYEVFRAATNGARVIFWNNLVRRDVPDNLLKHFALETGLMEKLKQQDKIFFYGHFKIYTIKK